MSTTNLILIAIDLVAALTLSFGIYYPRHRRREPREDETREEPGIWTDVMSPSLRRFRADGPRPNGPLTAS